MPHVYIIDLPKVKPMIIAIWCGEDKPPLNEYLGPFVAELEDLLINGISMNAHKICIRIGSFICDTPARVFLKSKFPCMQ